MLWCSDGRVHYICEGVLHQKEEAMKITTKQITTTAVLLAICIVSQFFKNTSVITPVTSFFITGSPIIGAIPAIMPCIMAGNALLVLGVGLVTKKCKGNGGLIAGMAAGSVVKALFMGIVISLILIPNLLPAPMEAKMAVFQTTFSVTQLVTSLIGSVYAFILWIPLKKVVK